MKLKKVMNIEVDLINKIEMSKVYYKLYRTIHQRAA